MQIIRLEPPHSTAVSNQFRRNIPLSTGQGGVDILSFASGLPAGDGGLAV